MKSRLVMAIRTTLFRRDGDTPASVANSVYEMEPSRGTCEKTLKQHSHRRHARSWALDGGRQRQEGK